MTRLNQETARALPEIDGQKWLYSKGQQAIAFFPEEVGMDHDLLARREGVFDERLSTPEVLPSGKERVFIEADGGVFQRIRDELLIPPDMTDSTIVAGLRGLVLGTRAYRDAFVEVRRASGQVMADFSGMKTCVEFPREFRMPKECFEPKE